MSTSHGHWEIELDRWSINGYATRSWTGSVMVDPAGALHLLEQHGPDLEVTEILAAGTWRKVTEL